MSFLDVIGGLGRGAGEGAEDFFAAQRKAQIQEKIAGVKAQVDKRKADALEEHRGKTQKVARQKLYLQAQQIKDPALAKNALINLMTENGDVDKNNVNLQATLKLLGTKEESLMAASKQLAVFLGGLTPEAWRDLALLSPSAFFTELTDLNKNQKTQDLVAGVQKGRPPAQKGPVSQGGRARNKVRDAAANLRDARTQNLPTEVIDQFTKELTAARADVTNVQNQEQSAAEEGRRVAAEKTRLSQEPFKTTQAKNSAFPGFNVQDKKTGMVTSVPPGDKEGTEVMSAAMRTGQVVRVGNNMSAQGRLVKLEDGFGNFSPVTNTVTRLDLPPALVSEDIEKVNTARKAGIPSFFNVTGGHTAGIGKSSPLRNEPLMSRVSRSSPGLIDQFGRIVNVTAAQLDAGLFNPNLRAMKTDMAELKVLVKQVYRENARLLAVEAQDMVELVPESDTVFTSGGEVMEGLAALYASVLRRMEEDSDFAKQPGIGAAERKQAIKRVNEGRRILDRIGPVVLTLEDAERLREAGTLQKGDVVYYRPGNKYIRVK